MEHAGHVDLYQLTSLIPHHEAGRTNDRVVLAFFSRGLPRRTWDGQPCRGWLLWAGLRRCLDHLEQARFSDTDIATLLRHPMLGPALARHKDLQDRLRNWKFAGSVWSPKEGTPLYAGRALRPNGDPLELDGVSPAAYCPYLLIETDLLGAKLIETPLLSIINHMTMVATKASHLVAAVQKVNPGAPILEFGQRRTHPLAAVDAAVAAWIAGCDATSNVQAHLEHGVPVSGTMDHFAVQAWERPGVPRHETERAYFEAFHRTFPHDDILLVDTYDTFGEHTGLAAAVAATGGRGPYGVRLDSNLSTGSIAEARRVLDRLGGTRTKIFVSGGLDEAAIAELAGAPIDGYGVGERIVTSPDAPVGVGAVAKVAEIDGHPSMKLSRGSGKATLPGRTQVWRTADGDLVGLWDEDQLGTPLLEPVWDATGRLPGPTLPEVREHARKSLATVPRGARSVSLKVTPKLVALVEQLVRDA